MGLKILGNCQVGGIADCLKLLSGGSTVEGILVSNDAQVLFGELSEQFSNGENQVLMHESIRQIVSTNNNLEQFRHHENIYIPSISFAAFHPDIQYAFVGGAVVKSGLDSDWNSRLMLWAYMNRLSMKNTENSFVRMCLKNWGILTSGTGRR